MPGVCAVGHVPCGIDGRLAMLRCDDNQRIVEMASPFQCADNLPNGRIHELDLFQQLRTGQGCGILITATGPIPV